MADNELFGNSEQLESSHFADPGNMVGDLIGRQAVMRAVNGLIDHFERILREIRETQVDDSVCGMCEYDGAFIGQSGNWCNECPGFEKDDCFKLSDECRKRWLESVKLPSAQRWIPCSERLPETSGQYYVSGGGKVWICEFLIISIPIGGHIGGWCNNAANPIVQAWMPLPAPAKIEG